MNFVLTVKKVVNYNKAFFTDGHDFFPIAVYLISKQVIKRRLAEGKIG